MSDKPRILIFAGSTRKDSYNKRLAKAAAAASQAAGAEVTLIDLADFPMPLYDQDLEAQSGLSEHARRFQDLMRSHQGFAIASPEYNSSITGVLKNALDWASRSRPEEPLVAFRGKIAALLSASPGNLGGLRSLVTLRSILSNIGVFVLPDQLAIPRAHEAFNETHALKDAKQQAALERLTRQLIEVTTRLAPTS